MMSTGESNTVSIAYTGQFRVRGPCFDHILDTSHDAFSQLNQARVVSRTIKTISISCEG